VDLASAGETAARGAEIAYDAFAPAYDDFTAGSDYELWLGHFLPKLEGHGLAARGALLDVGCGTGNSFAPMLKRGWEVAACDISAAMVELARAKVGDAAKLSVADMRELPDFGAFDLVWSLDDAVNYLLDEEELGQALSGMRRNLGPDGLLIFDVNTLGMYRTFFAAEETVEANGRRLVWRGRASKDAAPGSICEATIEAVSLEGEGDSGVATSLHRQRHFPEETMLAAMGRAGLECLDVFGHSDDAVPEQPLNELRHTKAVYISRPA
jgi:SAM-dependent methyltransferase